MTDSQTTAEPATYAEGRYARLSGGMPNTEALMRQILSEKRLSEDRLSGAAKWLQGYEDAENGK